MGERVREEGGLAAEGKEELSRHVLWAYLGWDFGV